MNDDARELLMMFILDAYSFSGKISKKTVIKMIKFVGNNPAVQDAINTGDANKLLSCKVER